MNKSVTVEFDHIGLIKHIFPHRKDLRFSHGALRVFFLMDFAQISRFPLTQPFTSRHLLKRASALLN